VQVVEFLFGFCLANIPLLSTSMVVKFAIRSFTLKSLKSNRENLFLCHFFLLVEDLVSVTDLKQLWRHELERMEVKTIFIVKQNFYSNCWAVFVIKKRGSIQNIYVSFFFSYFFIKFYIVEETIKNRIRNFKSKSVQKTSLDLKWILNLNCNKDDDDWNCGQQTRKLVDAFMMFVKLNVLEWHFAQVESFDD
jgi:hypothetical protein